jgi:hypothetical protein
MRRRDFIALLGGAATSWPPAARAQDSEKRLTIGFLGPDAAGWRLWTDAFVRRLRELGWIEGRNIAIERPSAPQQSSPYSMTLSAIASTLGGMARPSALAVVRLIASSNLVGCSIGISPGFVPRKILSTISAARWNRAGKSGP